MDVTTKAGSPRLDFEVQVNWPGLDGFLAVRFPLPVPCRMFGDIPFGLEDKDIPAEPYGKDHWVGPHSMERTREGLFYARSFVAVERPDEPGYAVISGNTDRYYLRQVTGRYLEHILINSVVTLDDWERQVEPSTLSGRGLHRFRFSLLVVPAGTPVTDIVREAEAARSPALVREIRRGAGPAALPDGPLLSVEPAGVNMTACYRDADEMVVRVHETTGAETEAAVGLPVAPRSARLTDFLGSTTPGDRPVIEGRSVRVRLSPWRIATLRLTF
jgi:alpha-mannosidase